MNPANNATTDFIVNTDNVTNALQVDASTDLTSIKTESAATNTVLNPLTLKRTSSAAPAVGIGTGLAFETETAVGNNEIGSIIESVSTKVTSNENFDMVFKNMIAGATATEAVRIKTEYDTATGTTPTGLSTIAAPRGRFTGYTGITGYDDGGLLIAETSQIQRVYTDFTTTGDITTTFGGNCLNTQTAAATTLGCAYWVSGATANASDSAGFNPQLPTSKGAQVQITASATGVVIAANVADGYTAVIGNATQTKVGASGVNITIPANETVVLQVVGDLSTVGSYGYVSGVDNLGAGVLLVLGKCSLAAF